MVAKFRERLAFDKQRSHCFHMERFILKRINKVKGKEKYRVEVPNRFRALETEMEVNSAWETIRESGTEIKWDTSASGLR
jgi:hypothetical protein